MQTEGIRKATVGDASRLTRFAAGIFRETFGPDNRASDLEAYMSEAFTVERQASEIEDAGNAIFIAETGEAAGSEITGYAHLAWSEPPPDIAGPVPVELKRFYIARVCHGLGLAQQLMERVLSEARAIGARTIWLGVWEHNPRAIAFYGKFGFQRVGEHTFMLGSDPQIDWLLARGLDS